MKIHNFNYVLKGVITIPKRNHFTVCLIDFDNLNNYYNNLQNHKNYDSFDGIIKEINNNINHIFTEFIPYVLFYIKSDNIIIIL